MSKCHYMADNSEDEILQESFKINTQPYCFPALTQGREAVPVTCQVSTYPSLYQDLLQEQQNQNKSQNQLSFSNA